MPVSGSLTHVSGDSRSVSRSLFPLDAPKTDTCRGPPGIRGTANSHLCRACSPRFPEKRRSSGEYAIYEERRSMKWRERQNEMIDVRVRCRGCGKVVMVGRADASASCPECGCSLAVTMQPLSSSPDPGSGFAAPRKGELPTEDKSARNAGCLIMGVLVLGVPMFIAAMTQDDNATYWVLAIAALIALIPLGVWFERNTIRRK